MMCRLIHVLFFFVSVLPLLNALVSHKRGRNQRTNCADHVSNHAPKLHFLSMGRSGSCFWGDLFGNKGGRPYIFEPFNENGWGLWDSSFEPFNPQKANGWQSLSESGQAQNLRRLSCMYECKGCDSEVAPDHRQLMANFCRGPAEVDRVVVKTVAVNDASTFLKLPTEALCGSKFVLMLRDPRGIENPKACQRMFSLAMSIKELTAAVGKENVRTLFYEQWSGDVAASVQDIATWANVTITPGMQEAMVTESDDSATKWLNLGEEGFTNGEQSWCKEFFELVGYPTREEVSSQDHLTYDHLKDPTLTPMTVEQQKLLSRFRGEDGYAWVRTRSHPNLTVPEGLHFNENL